MKLFFLFISLFVSLFVVSTSPPVIAATIDIVSVDSPDIQQTVDAITTPGVILYTTMYGTEIKLKNTEESLSANSTVIPGYYYKGWKVRKNNTNPDYLFIVKSNKSGDWSIQRVEIVQKVQNNL